MKVNPREKKLLIVVGIVVALIAGYYFLYMADGSLYNRWKRVNVDLERKEALLSDALRASRQEGRLINETFALQARLKFAERMLPKKGDIPKLMNDIDLMAKESGLTLNSLRPGSLEEREYYKLQPISLRFKCDLSSLVQLLYKFEKSDRLLDVQSMNITSDDDGNLNVSLELVTFVYTEEETETEENNKK
jgi:Tfp pilus assembly protein PilO